MRIDLGSKNLIDDKFLAETPPHQILVPANQIVKKILMDTPFLTNEEIVSVMPQDSLFLVKSKSGAEWAANKVICTFPAPQALKIFGTHHLTGQQSALLQTVLYTKKIICFVETKIVKDFSPDYTIEQISDFSMITFSDQVSEKYFEHSDLETITNLKKDYANLFSFTDCQHMNIKKWRYAVCNRPISQNYLSNDVNTLFLVGDYLGPKETTSLERTIRSSEAIFSLLEHH